MVDAAVPVKMTIAQMQKVDDDETVRQLEEAGLLPADGLDYHVFFGSDENLHVSEIWDSREPFEAFVERLMPILADAGIEFSGPPEIFEVHNSMKR